ncbi:MAG TPA: response regulator [Pseudobacteroides sp.]|uniref:response regulator n=1 Tax=Pseudobacteroides sp. TaxID=1968840 RepID=UPI002F94EEDE
MEKIRVVIVDDSEETRSNIKTILAFEKRFEVMGEAENGAEAVNIAKELRPDVILMDINMPVMDGIKATSIISIECPETSVIIMSVQGEQEYLRKAMSAGAREFITKPFSSDDLIISIINTYETEAKRKENIGINRVQEEIKSKVITVFSTKGGVGKTTISSNLAVSIARSTKKRVALLDLDLQFGDIAIMLNVTIKNTISDLIKEINMLDANLLDDYLVTHFSGVKVLPAPLKPEYAEYITSSHVEKIIKVLKENYHYIIIDTSASFHETVLTSLDLSDKILLVSTLDLPTIKNIKSGLDIMESLHYSKEKTKIVLNKASEQFGIKYKDFEETLKHTIWSYVPEDSATVITSANKGFPFVMTRTDTKVAKAIMSMADELTIEKAQVQKEKSSIKKLLGIY